MQKPSHFENKSAGTVIKPGGDVGKAVEGVTEMLIDLDYITIDIDQYTDLVKAEGEYGIIKQLYYSLESYVFDKVLLALYGPREPISD